MPLVRKLMRQGVKLRNLFLNFKTPRIRIWSLWLKCRKEHVHRLGLISRMVRFNFLRGRSQMTTSFIWTFWNINLSYEIPFIINLAQVCSQWNVIAFKIWNVTKWEKSFLWTLSMCSTSFCFNVFMFYEYLIKIH